ncbi:hypothetical protein H6F98_19985 [Microcoleus sp. FACHB-SPT15]|uniref:hypothetical protein n=1 Tax=Microcoleus sp. FACHB-SPT15 TaxID=2692830 RepID=UPI00177FFB31|nr:hypothetical protein [Microcoleus sp. FACHB-SPT15]MBD1807709.1 hypothetical protein [Microcoleus sp. FACHB-SPT15]
MESSDVSAIRGIAREIPTAQFIIGIRSLNFWGKRAIAFFTTNFCLTDSATLFKINCI